MLNTEINLYQVIELERLLRRRRRKGYKSYYFLQYLWLVFILDESCIFLFSSLKRTYFGAKSICLKTEFSCKKSSLLAFVSVSDQVSEDTTQ